MGITDYSDYYDDFAELYSEGSKAGEHRVTPILPKLQKHIKKGARVLDLCCGAGIFTIPLSLLGYDIVGVDIEEKMLKEARIRARERGSRAKFQKGDAVKLQLRSRFDSALMLGNTIPLFDYDSLAAIFGGVSKSLKPGGSLIVEYMEMAELMLDNYKPVLRESVQRNGPVYSFHSHYDKESGFLVRGFFNFKRLKYYELKLHVWTAPAVRYVARSTGFSLLTSEPALESAHGVLDVFTKS